MSKVNEYSGTKHITKRNLYNYANKQILIEAALHENKINKLVQAQVLPDRLAFSFLILQHYLLEYTCWFFKSTCVWLALFNPRLGR